MERCPMKKRTIIAAQRAYSDFIYDKAWYEFKFMPWVKKVWSVTNSAESNWFRKIERTLFFTAEFTFKAGYAKLIEWAAQASYEEPVTEIYLLISTADTLQTSSDLKILHEQGEKKILSITRWGIFTKTILEISDKNIDIKEIGGNDEIVVSVLADKGKTNIFIDDQLLYRSNVVIDRDRERQVYLLPVKRLLSFVKEAKNKGVEVEHIFDY